MRLDVVAGQRQFLDHLLPVWRALPEESRGSLIIGPDMVRQARDAGVRATTTWGHPAPTLVVSMGDQRQAKARGRRTLARMEHGIGQSFLEPNPSYAGGPECEDVDLFLMPNRYSADRWKARYPGALVEVVGSPHIDSLPARAPGPGPVVCISFHWRGLTAIPETGSGIDHFSQGLQALAKEFNVIGHGHPRAHGFLARHYRAAGIELVVDFEEVCRRADVYVCDSASTLYEFASTGRPVVVLNPPNYLRRGVRVEHGLRFWKNANVGVNCDSADALPAAIRLALADPPEQQAAREAALADVYAYRDGHAGHRAAAVLAAWSASITELPAKAPVRPSQSERRLLRRTPADRVAAFRASI